MKAGLFGGGWKDYLDTLNDAFDRHVAENAPPHPFGASVDAIMTGYPDDAGVSRGMPSGDARRVGMAQQAAMNFATNTDASRAFQGRSVQLAPVEFSVSRQTNPVSGTDAEPVGQSHGLQFPHGDQGGSSAGPADSAAFLNQPKREAVPAAPQTHAAQPGPMAIAGPMPAPVLPGNVQDGPPEQDGPAGYAARAKTPPPGPYDADIAYGATYAALLRSRMVDPKCDPDTAYACTGIDPVTGEISTERTPAYYRLHPVLRQFVEDHERKHREDAVAYKGWLTPNAWAHKNFDDDKNRLEGDAYQVQVDSINRYLADPRNFKPPGIEAFLESKKAMLKQFRKTP